VSRTGFRCSCNSPRLCSGLPGGRAFQPVSGSSEILLDKIRQASPDIRRILDDLVHQPEERVVFRLEEAVPDNHLQCMHAFSADIVRFTAREHAAEFVMMR